MARELVARGLAACVTRVPGAVSVYRWDGKLQEDREVQMLIKTTAEHEAGLVAALQALHPDAEPEVLALAVTGGSLGYLAWVEETLGA